MQKLHAIGIGHVTCDVVCPLQGWPNIDTKTIIPGITLSGGGPSANVVATLARLGVPVGLCGKLGDDVLGRYALQAHAAAGIDTSGIVVSAEAVSPVSIVLSDLAAATRTILLTRGERTALAPDELDFDWLRQARVIHLDGHQVAASLAVAEAARDWPDTQIVFDAGSLREGMLELARLCNIVLASKDFATALAGDMRPRQWLDALHAAGLKRVGVTLGSGGSVFSDAGQFYFQPAYQVEVQDTTGAGDSYQGGFIYGLLQGLTPPQCMRLGSAVAALKCRGLGARAALPTVDELNNFLIDAEPLATVLE